MVAPGCQLNTLPVDLAREGENAVLNLNCTNERYRPSDLGFLERRSTLQVLSGVDQRASDEVLQQLRQDELHILYAEGRLSDTEFRQLSN